MKPMFTRVAAAILAVLGWITIRPDAHAQAGYQTPDFDAEIFQVDALSLEDREREEIVSALAALVRNFSSDDQVDDDLREKALAIALRLDPLDGVARDAHEALVVGRSPESVDYFSSLSSISEALWKYAETLSARDADPEDRKLAPFLMEISLIINSSPNADRLRKFGRATGLKPVNWSRVVNSQGTAYGSNRRAVAVLRAAEQVGNSATAPRPGGKSKGSPKSSGTPKPANPGSTPSGPISEIKKPQTSLRFVAWDPEAGAISGEARLNVRKPAQDERSLFGLFLGNTELNGDFEMRLSWDRDGPIFAGYDEIEPLVRKSYPYWPKNVIGEFSFTAAGPKQPDRVAGSLAASVLLESAFAGKAIPADIAVAGQLSESGKLEIAGPARQLCKAAAAGDENAAKVLLLPAAAESSINDAVTAGDLSVLVQPQVIGFATVEEAQQLMLGDRPEKLADAIQKFDSIQKLTVSQGMPLDEIARNSAVQTRLQEVLETWPGHLSAKVMLAYGSAPVDMQLSSGGSVRLIDEIIEPVAKYYTDMTFGGGAVVGEAEKLVEDAVASLRALRSKVNPDTRNCLNLAEDALRSFEEYFSLTNKGSSRATQLRRDLQEAINALNTERTRLGASENISL